MSKREAKLIYEAMLDNDDIYVMMPGATGDWLTDKDQFMDLYNVNTGIVEDLLNDENYEQ